MADEPTTINVWAPEIFYDDENDQFMVVWASCVPGRFEKGIEEENNNHRLYYITTKILKPFRKQNFCMIQDSVPLMPLS